jgi:deoxyadenosine/deoxycytidine kinase
MGDKTFIVQGNIASGKTTLCKLLELQNIDKTEVIYEPVDKWISLTDSDGNNILKLYYDNKERYAYTLQTYAFLTRAKLLKEKQKKPLRFMERCIMTDKHVFAKALYETNIMSELEWKMYNDWSEWIYNDIIQSNGEPSGYIYIRCDPEISYERLKIRSRSEEDTVPLEYLQLLHKYHDEWLLNDKNVLVIDVNKDFEHDKEELERIMNKINEFVGCKKVSSSITSTCILS